MAMAMKQLEIAVVVLSASSGRQHMVYLQPVSIGEVQLTAGTSPLLSLE